jgi:hypothetical protein
MRLAAIILGTCAAASAQMLIDASQAARVLQHVDPQANSSLRCETTPVPPTLGFSLRFQTGYEVRVPLSQFHGPGHRISVLLRVSPELKEAQPAYLLRSFDLPDVPDTEFVAEVAGSFLVGQGSYHSMAIVLDDLNRVCRSDWRIEVKPGRKERNRLVMRPNTMAPLTTGSSGGATADTDALHRMTIFLHAAPLNRGTSKLVPSDVLTVTGSLAALLEQLPAQAVRLVIFNLEQQRELYRNDGFTSRDLEQVAAVLDGLQLAMVDYRVLQRPQGQAELLRALMHREVQEAAPADLVIFLGPDGSSGSGEPAGDADTIAAGQRILYLQYESSEPWFTVKRTTSSLGLTADPRPKYPCQMWPCSVIPAQRTASQQAEPTARTASGRGAIGDAIRKLKGRILVVRTPGDFAKAVDQIGTPGR